MEPGLSAEAPQASAQIARYEHLSSSPTSSGDLPRLPIRYARRRLGMSSASISASGPTRRERPGR